ncbi:hypothetical protein EJ07DRAFT_158867 [Lizonia empirigonia]|nr:hypothetical protein EJ07DRAFT_158867 [Lizonia empirigonia]
MPFSTNHNMAPRTNQEVVNISWPMTIPPHAYYLVTSAYPLKVSYSYTNYTLTFDEPMNLSSPSSPVRVIPSGPLSPGFARGWSKLPTELKLVVLRHVVVHSAEIWQTNVNAAIRDTLFPCLQMTPEIGRLARGVFFAENTFVFDQRAAVGSAPPVSVRPLLKKVVLVTKLEDGDWEMVDAVAKKRLGYRNITHAEIRCSAVDFIRAFRVNRGTAEGRSTEAWDAYLERQLPPEVAFAPNGVVVFDHLQSGRGGVDEELLERVEQVKELLRERFRFGVR